MQKKQFINKTLLIAILKSQFEARKSNIYKVSLMEAESPQSLDTVYSLFYNKRYFIEIKPVVVTIYTQIDVSRELIIQSISKS